MKKYTSLFLIALFLISCKDDELPIRGVYGDPGGTMVFNLKLVDAQIEDKKVTASGNAFGKIRVVGDGSYLIYESDPDFTSDGVTVSADNREIVTVRFLANNLDNTCKSFAISYDIKVKKNSPLSSTPISTPKLCGLSSSVEENPFISMIGIEQSGWLDIASVNNSVSLRYQPPQDFVGVAEAIYELGYRTRGTQANISDISQFGLLVSGFVRITVEE